MKFIIAISILFSLSILPSFPQTSEVDVFEDLSDFLLIDGKANSSISTDTSLVLNQVYIPSFKSSYQNIFTGNFGTASFSLVKEIPYGEFIDWGINHYDDYKLGIAERNIILDKKPYSRVNYLIGTKKEQMLNVTHQQHITKNMITGIDFLAQASNGFYSGQLSKQRSFDAFYLMHSNNNLYSLLATYTSNKHEAQENGGIVNDTLFINQTDSRDAEESLVNLIGAKSLNKDNNYFLKQKIYLSGKTIKSNVNDSLINNSLSIALTNTTKYSRRVFIFSETDVNVDFFNSIYYDSVSTYDSSFVSDIHSRFGMEFNKTLNSNTDVKFDAFTNYQEFNFFQNSIDTSISSLDLGISAHINQKEAIELSFKGKVGLSEKLKESYFFQAKLNYNLSKKIKIESEFSSVEKPGSIIYKLFDSNHFKWANDFKNINYSTIDVSIGFEEFVKIKYNLKDYGNYLFFDSLATAKQFGKDIQVSKVEFSHKLNYKKINYNGNSSYNISTEDKILPVPKIQVYHSLYFEDRLLKVGMPVQIGIDIRYHTKYFAQAYMPATGQRYIQTKQEIGNYLFADFFLNFRINHSKIFFKVDHFNEGFSKRNYFIMPYHPMMGRSFKIGIKWAFFD